MSAARAAVREHAGDAVRDDVDRTGDRVGRDRHAAGHRFEQHQAEGVGAAGKDEHVRLRDQRGKRLAIPEPGEHHRRIARAQVDLRGPATHDELAARNVEREKVLDALFHGNPPEVEPDRSRQIEIALRLRTKQSGVHATAPVCEIAETALLQLPHHRWRRDEGARPRAMQPAQVRVGQRERNRRPSPHVLGKLRVIRSRERPSAPPAPAAGREPERTLGGDVDRLGRKPIEAPGELTIRKDGEADLRIGRTRDGPKAPGMHHFDDMARAFEFGDCDRERPYDAVGLWRPGIRDHRYSHASRWRFRVTVR